MKLFNDQATAAVASLDSADVAYCAKLEQRFAHMGISSKGGLQRRAVARRGRRRPPGWRLGRPALRVQGPLPEENRGEARRLRGVRGFLCPKRSLRRAVADASASPHGATSLLAPCCRVCICHVPPGVLSHRLSSLAGCQFPTQGSLGFPKRKATPPKSAGSLQVSSSKFR